MPRLIVKRIRVVQYINVFASVSNTSRPAYWDKDANDQAHINDGPAITTIEEGFRLCTDMECSIMEEYLKNGVRYEREQILYPHQPSTIPESQATDIGKAD